MDEAEKSTLEFIVKLIWAMDASISTFSIAKAMSRALILTPSFKSAIFLQEHFHTNGGKGYGD